jgi:predicted nucleic acid-binding protein
MILLDTNVISEPLRRTANPAVLAWIDAQSIETLYLSAVSLAELRFGVAVMPRGKRQYILQTSLERRVVPSFAGRILPFDVHASLAYAELRARARVEGKAIATADGYIAATAAAHGLTVASRDTAPFVAAGLRVIDPWAESQ